MYKSTILLISFLLSLSLQLDGQITRAQIIANAWPYVNHQWTAGSSNIWNNVNCGNKQIITPSWVGVGTHYGLPYCWGGFTDVSAFNGYISQGKSAGDICASSCGYNFGAEPLCAVGLDCSGYVSRAWELSFKHSTSSLPGISTQLGSFTQLLEGDIINKVGSHTRLVEYVNPNGSIDMLESGFGTSNAPGGLYRVFFWNYSYTDLQSAVNNGYVPLVYNALTGTTVSCDDCNSSCNLTSSTSCNWSNHTVLGATTSIFSKASCDAFSGNASLEDVWFSFTAMNTTSTVEVDPLCSAGSPLDLVVEVRNSQCSGGSVIDCDDPTGSGPVTLNLTGLNIGSTYYIRVYDYGAIPPACGDFRICVTHSSPDYTVSVSASPSNGGSVSGNGTYPGGSSVTVSANPSSGWNFDNWTEGGNVVSNSQNYSFSINSNRNLVANFSQAAPNTYTISVSASPSNAGSVSGPGTVNSGSSATVTATANTNWTFENWTENGNIVSPNASYTFTATSNRNLVANFSSLSTDQNITLSPNPSNGGTVSGGGMHPNGQSITVNATANAGWGFTNWTENGTIVSLNASYSFTVNGTRNLVANFENTPCILALNADPSNGGTVSGGGNYLCGLQPTAEANPNNGWEFKYWYENPANPLIVSTSPSYQFTIMESKDLYALFEPIDPNSIDKLEILSFSLYPNPTQNQVFIQLPVNMKQQGKVDILDLSGRLIQENAAIQIQSSSRYSLNLSGLATGMYLIRLSQDGKVGTEMLEVIP